MAESLRAADDLRRDCKTDGIELRSLSCSTITEARLFTLGDFMVSLFAVMLTLKLKKNIAFLKLLTYLLIVGT